MKVSEFNHIEKEVEKSKIYPLGSIASVTMQLLKMCREKAINPMDVTWDEKEQLFNFN